VVSRIEGAIQNFPYYGYVYTLIAYGKPVSKEDDGEYRSKRNKTIRIFFHSKYNRERIILRERGQNDRAL